MKIAQVSLAVPDEIYEGILAGTLEIAAGVVRDNKGVIRKHLPKVAVQAKDSAAKAVKAAKGNGAGIVQVVKKNPVAAIGIGAVAAVGGGVTFSFYYAQNLSRAFPSNIANFNKCSYSFIQLTK